MHNFLFILLTFLSFNLFSQFCSTIGLADMGVITPTGTFQNVSNAALAKRYWRFTATLGCTYNFSTCNSVNTNDTYLRLYSTATGGTVLAQNDDGGPFCSGTKASLTWVCPANGTYSILVTNYSCANLSAATILSYRVTCVTPFNPCSSITTLSCGVSTTFTISSGNGLYNPPSTSCGFTTPGRERIFQITPTISGNYRISQPTSFGYIDWFYKLSSGGCTGTGWTCIDDISSGNIGNSNANIPLTAGLTYYIMGDPESTIGGNVTFTLNCPVIGPCFATSPWTVLNMPTSPSTVSSTCLSGDGQFTDEYSTWNTGIAGTIYNVQSSLSTDWVTVTVGSPSGTVIGYGTNPISFTAPSNNTYYVHITTNGYCVGDANCRDITVNRISSLPIELVSFNGMKKNGDNFLYWVTASERDNDYFTLEYSIDGEFWLDISNINAAGNSQQELSYSYTHKTYDRSVTNYYKLSQTDFNGVRTYFNNVSITNTPNQKEVVKIVNTIGQEVNSFSPNGMYFEIYDDGSIIKVMK